MPYVSGGQVLDGRPRSFLQLSFYTDIFWNVLDFFVKFFRTMIDPNYNGRGDRYTTDYRVGSGGSSPQGGPPRPPPGPRRRMGGFGGGAGGPACPPMAGGG